MWVYIISWCLGIPCFDPCEGSAKDEFGRVMREDMSQCYYVREDCGHVKEYHGYRQEAIDFYTRAKERETLEHVVYPSTFYPQIISGVTLDSTYRE